MTDARLIDTRIPRRPQAVVLVLHGGAARQDRMRVSPTQLSVLRMVPIARRVARAGRGRLAVLRLLNSTRGWDTRHTPVDDVVEALGQVRDRFGDLPVGLVGHSLGGRAALIAAKEDGVRSAVALAPYVYVDDPVDAPGRQVLIVHGDQDRIASLQRSAALARRMAASTDVGFVQVAGGTHSMLRHHDVFDRLAAEFTTATLLGDEPQGTVADVLAGQGWVDV